MKAAASGGSPVTGYSGTPLAKKLGIVEACRVLLVDAPPDYARLLAPLPPRVVFARRASAEVDLAQLFVTNKATLGKRLDALRRALRPDAAIWVSWPKQAAKVATDVTEGTVREVALPLGLVDVKVCAVDATWSGLKLVVRKALR